MNSFSHLSAKLKLIINWLLILINLIDLFDETKKLYFLILVQIKMFKFLKYVTKFGSYHDIKRIILNFILFVIMKHLHGLFPSELISSKRFLLNYNWFNSCFSTSHVNFIYIITTNVNNY
jgi:hypothetical protein